MQEQSASNQKALEEIAQRHGFSCAAVQNMLEAIARGRASMAQFDHPDFGGSGQWMRGGMTMVGDMFNHTLKTRVAALASELAEFIEREPKVANESNDGRSDEAGARNSNKAWWPNDLGSPNSTGSQNDMRYAYFAGAHRLVIDDDGKLTVYDTLDHRIGGVAQQQSGTRSLRFTSQHGPVALDSLPVVSAGAEAGS